MSINIQAKTNYSFLFSGLSSSASNALSGNWLADYASIKNGSYGKLMKAYYAKDSGDSKTAASTITKKDTATDTAKKALAKELAKRMRPLPSRRRMIELAFSTRWR